MNNFKVTKDRRVFLDDIEIDNCFGFELLVEAGEPIKVRLTVSCERVSIEDYTDVFRSKENL